MVGGQVLSQTLNTIHNNENELFALNYNKIDINKTYKIDDKWALIPGFRHNGCQQEVSITLI